MDLHSVTATSIQNRKYMVYKPLLLRKYLPLLPCVALYKWKNVYFLHCKNPNNKLFYYNYKTKACKFTVIPIRIS